MTVSLAEIDRLITDWENNVQLVSHNLLELQNLPIVQTLSAPEVQLTGVTAQQVAQGLRTLTDLFTEFTLLSDLLAQATSLRQKLHPKSPNEAKLQDIARLFSEPTVALPAVMQPLAQRSILGAPELVNYVTPADLLIQMNQTFICARDVLLGVDQAWRALEPELLNFQRQIESLRQQTIDLGLTAPPALAQAETKLAELRDRVFSDPLGSQADFQTELQPLLQSVERTLTILTTQQSQLQDQFVMAQQQLKQLQQQNIEILALYQECQEKVADIIQPLQQPLPATSITGLRDWLDRLTQKHMAGDLQPVLVGLDNWLKQAKQLLSQQTQAIATNRAPIDQRLELRGRLEALQAKAKARGRAEDPQLTAWANHARELLYSRPSPLQPAIGLLTAYEQRLNQATPTAK
jgi:hypothetical protein